MTHVCEGCHRAFPTRQDLEMHRDGCVDDKLVCRRCGSRFPESTATTDGWHYRCPEPDCEGEGLGDDLVGPEKVRVDVS